MAATSLIERAIERVARRVANLVARAVVQLADDGRKMQILQLAVGADEMRSEIERFQEYGFSSVPLPGAEAVVVFVGGFRDHGLAVALDDRRYRPTGLKPGEVALYNHAGASVTLLADGTVEIRGASKVNVEASAEISVNAPSIVLNGGTQPIARVGDTAGPYPIVGGNPTVKA